MKLRIKKFEWCYLYSQYIRINKQTQFHEKKNVVSKFVEPCHELIIRNEKVTLLLTAAVLHADTEIRESISSVSAGPIIFNDEMFSDNSGARVKYSI